jgi:hypothetical protein
MPLISRDKYEHNISPMAWAQTSTSARERDCSDTFFPTTDIVVITKSVANRRAFGEAFGSSSVMNHRERSRPALR